MSYITRVGNLAKTPELRQGENGPYLYARVIVTDRIRNDTGEWADSTPIGYDVSVPGAQAAELHRTATESGNIRVLFTGRYVVKTYVTTTGDTRISHVVYADEIGVSLRNQHVAVIKDTPEAADVVAEGDQAWADLSTE